ncbi:helix-turn-helix domain-containing protein [Hymenobacter cellulosivorans]|uniref:AraC family transcriptional regulator n=1 Tax=Hymenobacter cellulosivorans TaxID=2932249 RepID=A0ABY4FGP8_9BACT|nr:AraC family transcriptional regulator [Hymenobacter cellulosivorans]UOQ55725.1 AraC family transcriptional regulator [Hymenobacter cellulosivorans]
MLPATRIYPAYPHLLGLTELTRLAMAPALYLSIVHFTSPDRRGHPKDLLHLIPALLFLLYMLPFLLQTAEEKRAILHGHFPAQSAFSAVLGQFMFYAVKLQILGYWVASYLHLLRHQQNVPRFASSPDRIDLNWMKYFLLSLIFMVGLWLNELFFRLPFILMLTPWLFLVAVYGLSYFSLRQPEVFDFPEPEAAELDDLLQQPATAEKTAPPRLLPHQVKSLKEKLGQLMQREKLFLEANLGLPDLARHLELSSHELSYLLNHGFGQNFFQFINEYRVEEAKRLLLSDQHRHLNMLGVAYEAGFSSKTTFNTTFKKLVGQSPSQFARAHSTPPLKEASGAA